MTKAIAAAITLAAAAMLLSQPQQGGRILVGPQPGGGVLLNSGAVLRPAGRQVGLDTLPMSTALSPDGRFLLVLNAGYNPPSISVIEVKTEKETARVPVADAWLGLAFSPNGRFVYVGGGSQASVFEFSFSPEGRLEPSRTFPVVPEAERKHQDFIGDVALTPDGRLIYAANLFRDQVVVINPQSGRVIERFKTARRPYRILFHPDGKSFFLTSWADASLHHHESGNGNQLSFLRLGAHPTDMVWRGKATQLDDGGQAPWQARLFVSAAHTNKVYVVGVSASKDLRVVETINVAASPRQPLGMTPSALALSQDENLLHVVCSDANMLAVVDVEGPSSVVLGFIPAGWYPTAARALPGGRLVVLNGRGGRSYPNPRGPNPAARPSPVHGGLDAVQYVGRLQRGSASIIDPFDGAKLAEYTRTALDGLPFRERDLDGLPAPPPGNPVPARPGEPTPIRHVVYIVKENRTYDQVLGGMDKGNGDPSLVLFGERITPNHHKLAREFVLLDNFYVSADVSADGHNWSTAAIAPDYVQKLWQNSYGKRRKHYDYEGTDPASLPPAGYIWNNVLAAGLSMRNYGYLTNIRAKPGADGVQIDSLRDPALAPHTNMHYRPFDMDYPDVERARVFLRDVASWERDGAMPRFLIVRLGNDHTSGTSPGKITPQAAVADNDYALGLIVEGLSRSRFWPQTAVFVLQDDAQNGSDHVDSHRAPAFVISPYSRRGTVDSTFYNTTSMLRTMGLILGLHPMTLFDAGAQPMWFAFSATADPTPYTVEAPRIPLDSRNPAQSAGARESLAMDFSEADRIDDNELNAILWRAIRGGEAPPPVRSYFSR